jgi:hypothetical protein
VADGSAASGLLALAPGIVVASGGFDAIMFQRYPFDPCQTIHKSEAMHSAGLAPTRPSEEA